MNERPPDVFQHLSLFAQELETQSGAYKCKTVKKLTADVIAALGAMTKPAAVKESP
jgi:hypothetical protein